MGVWPDLEPYTPCISCYFTATSLAVVTFLRCLLIEGFNRCMEVCSAWKLTGSFSCYMHLNWKFLEFLSALFLLNSSIFVMASCKYLHLNIHTPTPGIKTHLHVLYIRTFGVYEF